MPSAGLATPTDPPLPSPPAASRKREFARWQSQAAARTATIALRAAVHESFDGALRNRLGSSRGITVVPAPATPAGHAAAIRTLTIASQTGGDSAQVSAELAAYARGVSGSHGADACLLTVVDRFGSNTGFERDIWLRAAAWLWRERNGGEGSFVGPFFAIGRAVAGRKLIGKGFGRTDEQLVQDAGHQAANRLVATLETGRRPLFMDDCRAAVLPAEVPASVVKSVEISSGASDRGEESHQTISLPLSSIHRQRDVLFQPETSPVTVLVNPAAVVGGMEEVGRDIAKLRLLSSRLGVDYLFASRVRDVEVSDRPDVAPDAGQLRAAVRRQADVEVEGILYGAREDAILWSDTVTGGTVAVTEYVRHQPRLRSDEQCLVDAARTAYAHLRSSFDEYRRKMDRESRPVSR